MRLSYFNQLKNEADILIAQLEILDSNNSIERKMIFNVKERLWKITNEVSQYLKELGE